MKLEAQVCSLALAQRLKALGVKQENAYYTWHHNDGGWKLQPSSWAAEFDDYCAAFTVAELGELLPYSTLRAWRDMDGRWWPHENPHRHPGYATEADLRASMLVALIEAGAVSATEVGR